MVAFYSVVRLVNAIKKQKMKVMRAPVHSLNRSVPNMNPLTIGTPKLPQTTSDDDQVFQTHIEELISCSIKTELNMIGDTLTVSMIETVQKSVKNTIDEYLKIFQFDLEACKMHLTDIDEILSEKPDRKAKCSREG